jgi:hypothetical protein
MLRQQQYRANIGVGAGALLQMAGVLLLRTQSVVAMAGLVLILVSLPVFIWGCMNYAQAKGHSEWVGVVGLAGVIGLIALVLLPDQTVSNSAAAETDHQSGRAGFLLAPYPGGTVARLLLLKFLVLLAMVAGFAVAVLGVWLDQPLAIADRLDPLPAICMILGACLAIGSILFLAYTSGR